MYSTITLNLNMSCKICNQVVKNGVNCIRCNAKFHRRCEKLVPGDDAGKYMCKPCAQEEIEESDTGSIVSATDSFFDSSIANIVDENERLVEENKSLMEAIRSLQEDKSAAEKKIRLLVDANEELKRQLNASDSYNFRNVSNKKRYSATTSTTTVKLANRFQLLSKEFPPLPNPVVKADSRPKQGKLPRRRILVIGDSHARGCSAILNEQVGADYSVEGVVKPNARLCDVVKDVGKLAADFTKEDHVVVIGGTNDLGQQRPHQYTIIKGLQALVDLRKTNVTVTSIPQRYDVPKLNALVQEANATLEQVTSKQQHMKYVNTQVTRNLYTRHGLHLNHSGKEEICKIIKDTISNVPSKKLTFLDRWVLRPPLTKENVQTTPKSKVPDKSKSTFLDRWLLRPQV